MRMKNTDCLDVVAALRVTRTEPQPPKAKLRIGARGSVYTLRSINNDRCEL
jgi:hypothetical protein